MDAAFIKQAVASAVIGVVIEKLASILDVCPFKGRNLSHGSRQKLRIVLLSAEAELIEARARARAKQITNPAVKKWLGLLSDAVYEAEELLDKIDRTEAESQTRKRKFSDFFSGFVNLFGKGLESELQEVLERLEYMTEHKDLPGLKEVAGEVPLQQLTSCSVESHVYGRYCDIEAIFKLWQSDGQAIRVLSIVGMGGIGKTTLAQMVYHDRRVNENFDLKAWVCVSEFYNSFEILKTILEQISWFTCDTQNLSSLQTKIRKTLKGKKFVLILDDVWNENYNDWVEFLKVFECGAQEIKILVTTRSKMVASHVSSVRSYDFLKELSDDCCWALFAQHAFGNGKHHEFEELEEIGRVIVS